MNTTTSDFGVSRRMPYSLEAEQAVLGSILIDPERINDVVGIIKADDFYLEEHRAIFLAMQDLYIKNKTIDVVTLIDTLVKNEVYSDEDSRRYIKLIAQVVPSAANIRDYAQIVQNKSLLRRLIEACNEITEQAYAETEDVDTLLDAAEQRIFEIAEYKESKGFIHIKDAILQEYEHLKLLRTDKEAAIGIPTGFRDLDDVIVGMGPGDLILVGARPGMGKTSFAMNIATRVAMRSGKTVCVFSLEMSAQQLVTRMMASEALVDSYKLRTGDLDKDDWAKLARATSMLSECNILIDDSTGITVTGMKAKLRRVRNLGLVVIDYLQLMQSDRRIDNRVQEVAEISRGLKLLAKEFKVPIITCAQLSRSPESRTDKRPMLSDLRDSGAIEQDADIVLFLYREEYYNEKEDKHNTAEIIVAKNRHGSTKRVEVGWFGKYTRFSPISDLQEDLPPGNAR